MDNFSIVLPNEKYRMYKIIAILISIINIFGFAFCTAKTSEENSSHLLFIIGFSMVSSPLVSSLVFKKSGQFNLANILVSLMLASIFWVIAGFYFAGCLQFISAISGLFAVRRMKIDFKYDYIFYPSIPSKKIKWNEIANLVLKDNILTIDLKNNKLIQYRIKESENDGLNEDSFNTFVQQRITQSFNNI